MPKWIDLSLPYAPDMPGFGSEIAKTMEKDGWNARHLRIYSHAGTHMDAPFHFDVTDTFIDEIPVDRLSGRAWKAEIKIDAGSQLIGLEEVVSQLPKWKAGDSLLIQTEWSQYAYENWDMYRNSLPRISEELANWCVDARVNILGVEPPSVANVNDLEEVSRIHQILLGGEILIVEGLCQLELLPSGPFELFAFPLKIKQGDGAPARVMAKVS